MVIGLAHIFLIFGLMLPLQLCRVSDFLSYPGFETRAAREVEAHRRVRQTILWSHDDGFALGRSGTKDDLRGLLEFTNDESFGSCAGGHRDSALEDITNQRAGDSLAEWKEWWAVHSHQTQAQWTMDGFKAKGIEFSLPPDHATCLRLLKLLGRDSREVKRRFEENPPERSLPSYIIVNIHRVLFHHEFDGVAVTREDIASDPSGELLDGLKSVLSNRVANSFLSDPFHDDEDKFLGRMSLGGLHPSVMWMHTFIAFVVFQSGFYLWLRARFRLHRQEGGVNPIDQGSEVLTDADGSG